MVISVPVALVETAERAGLLMASFRQPRERREAMVPLDLDLLAVLAVLLGWFLLPPEQAAPVVTSPDLPQYLALLGFQARSLLTGNELQIQNLPSH